MKPKTVLLILALTGMVISCIPSLYPLYREKDLLLDKELPGVYEGDDDDFWEIRHLDAGAAGGLKGDWKHYKSGYTYRLSVVEDGVKEEFALHLLELGGYRYLDFLPVGYEIRPEFLAMHLAPAHIFARAEISEDYLILHFFDMD